MSQGPVTRFKTRNNKLKSTVLLLVGSCAPWFGFLIFVFPHLAPNSKEQDVAIAVFIALVFASVALYTLGYKRAPLKVYSPKEIETWFNNTGFAKVLKFLGGIVVYWRTLLSLLVVAVWLAIMAWDIFIK